MDFVVASSRGGGLKPHLPRGTTVDVNPGAELHKLKDRAVKLISPPNRPYKPHVYFIGGVPDISELVKSESRSFRYREVIYVEKCEDTIERVKKNIMICQSSVVRNGAVPIFCTIPKYNLALYNNSLLQNQKTTCLLHSEHYQDMQERMDSTIDSVNDFIIRTNARNNVHTPCLHTSIKRRRGRAGHGYYVYLWHLLKDGLHAGDYLLTEWAKALKAAIRKNRSDDSDEENRSPKRSWRSEKRQRTV